MGIPNAIGQLVRVQFDVDAVLPRFQEIVRADLAQQVEAIQHFNVRILPPEGLEERVRTLPNSFRTRA